MKVKNLRVLRDARCNDVVKSTCEVWSESRTLAIRHLCKTSICHERKTRNTHLQTYICTITCMQVRRLQRHRCTHTHTHSCKGGVPVQMCVLNAQDATPHMSGCHGIRVTDVAPWSRLGSKHTHAHTRAHAHTHSHSSFINNWFLISFGSR